MARKLKATLVPCNEQGAGQQLTWDQGVDGVAPLRLDLVEVGVADAYTTRVGHFRLLVVYKLASLKEE